MNTEKRDVKRVLHISPGFTGGIATHINNIVLGIDNSRIIIDLAAFPADKKKANVFVEDVVKKGGKIFDLVSPKKNPIMFYKQIYSILNNNERYEMVHVHMHGIRFMIISLLTRISGAKRIISHAHIADGKDSRKVLNRLRHIIEVGCTKVFATEYVSCSKRASEYVFGKSILNKKKVMHIPNSIDNIKYSSLLSEKKEKNLIKELDIKKDDLIIVNVGYFGYQKNHPFMIEIIKKLANKNINFIWLFVGIGEEEEKIKKIVSDNKTDKYVRFLGFRHDIPDLLKLSDVLVLPSIFEGLPTVAIEAQAAGTPCILSTNVSSEADLNLGLCKFLNLDDDIEEWCNEIINSPNGNKPTKKEITTKLESKGFTTITAAKLYEMFVEKEITSYEL